MTFRRKGDKAQYSFLDAKCIGRKCWAPGMYQHRSPLAGGGSRNTGSPDTPCCMNRAYNGCPEGPEGEYSEACPLCNGETDALHPCEVCSGSGNLIHIGTPAFQSDLAKERRQNGWKPA